MEKQADHRSMTTCTSLLKSCLLMALKFSKSSRRDNDDDDDVDCNSCVDLLVWDRWLRLAGCKFDMDIKRRIAMAKDAHSKMKNILTNSKIIILARLKLLGCYIFSVLTYGSESWTISKKNGKKD
ncbi:hypothetical protein HELRODRAFT_174388 [Helobdella robusta]|uniref:Uncharacterized protein n=1 Tax=Helobdella robusta TaxID=6412 RepID=T1F826_HELRO|nr:hypothetical protein HELRODRAFT_174388 [Helobdella robusta]ESO02921.1 hypothetical protein HELRODRAFT_174388 [Helobdella robusta]